MSFLVEPNKPLDLFLIHTLAISSHTLHAHITDGGNAICGVSHQLMLAMYLMLQLYLTDTVADGGKPYIMSH